MRGILHDRFGVESTPIVVDEEGGVWDIIEVTEVQEGVRFLEQRGGGSALLYVRNAPVGDLVVFNDGETIRFGRSCWVAKGGGWEKVDNM